MTSKDTQQLRSWHVRNLALMPGTSSGQHAEAPACAECKAILESYQLRYWGQPMQDPVQRPLSPNVDCQMGPGVQESLLR